MVNVQQNGQIPPSVFNTWYNEVSDWYFRKLAEDFQLNQIISDFLSPFIVPVNVLITDQRGQNFGVAKYPVDYEFLLNITLLRQKEENTCFCNKDLPIIDGSGMSKKYTDPDLAQMTVNFAGAGVEETQVSLIDTQRWPACLNHYTKGPTWKQPKATQFQAGFKISPKGITSVVMTYLKTPVKSVFAYTVSSDDIAIYNSGGSTQLEWSEQVTPVFLAKLITKYGLYIDDAGITKMGDDMLMLATKVQ